MSRKITLFVCVLVCALVQESFSAGPGQSASVTSVSYLFAKATAVVEVKLAVESLKKKDLVECKRLLVEAKDLNPGIPAPDIILAQLIFEAGGAGEAISVLDQYAIEAPSDPLTYVLLGEIALKTRRFTDAWLHSEKAIALGVKPTEELRLALSVLQGEIALNRKQWSVAENAFGEWAKLRTDEAAPIWAQGKLKLLQEDFEGAKTTFAKARGIDSTLPQPQFFIASYLSSKPENDQCEEWYRDGLKAKDSTMENWQGYISWLVSRGRAADAGKLTERVSKEFQEKREMRFLGALVARYLGKNDLAEKGFSDLHQQFPDDVEAADQLALVLVESTEEGKRARAQQLSEANVRRFPNQEVTIATAAWIQFKLGSADIADRIFSELASKTPVSPQTGYYIAQLMKARGKEEDAKKILEAIVKQPGNFVQRKSVLEALEKE